MNSRTRGTQQECRKKVRLWGITPLKKWKMILGTKVNIRKTFLFFHLYLPDLKRLRYSQLYKLHISDFIFIAPKINRTLSCGLGPLGICFLALFLCVCGGSPGQLDSFFTGFQYSQMCSNTNHTLRVV